MVSQAFVRKNFVLNLVKSLCASNNTRKKLLSQNWAQHEPLHEFFRITFKCSCHHAPPSTHRPRIYQRKHSRIRSAMLMTAGNRRFLITCRTRSIRKLLQHKTQSLTTTKNEQTMAPNSFPTPVLASFIARFRDVIEVLKCIL